MSENGPDRPEEPRHGESDGPDRRADDRGDEDVPEWIEHRHPGYAGAGPGEREVSEEEVLAHEEALPEPGEHDFEPDVERIHRPILREPRDPREGRERAPWWVWAAAALALFWGGWYLGRYGGRFGPDTHLAYAGLEAYVEEEAAEERVAPTVDPVAAGLRIYTSRCQVCHQPNGLGVPGAFPPLVGSEWVVGPPEIPVLILLHGLQGPITVRGEAYNGAMPAWQDALNDAEIAAVATYIRGMESNDAGPVEPDLVARLREATAQRRTPWTADELTEAARSPEIRAAVEAAAPGSPSGSAS